VEKLSKKITAIEDELRCYIKKCVVEIRSDKCESTILTELCKKCAKKVDEADAELEEIEMCPQPSSICQKISNISTVCLLL